MALRSFMRHTEPTSCWTPEHVPAKGQGFRNHLFGQVRKVEPCKQSDSIGVAGCMAVAALTPERGPPLARPPPPLPPDGPPLPPPIPGRMCGGAAMACVGHGGFHCGGFGRQAGSVVPLPTGRIQNNDGRRTRSQALI